MIGTRFLLGALAVLLILTGTSAWLLKRAYAEAATLRANYSQATQAVNEWERRYGELEAERARVESLLAERERSRQRLATETETLKRRLTHVKDHCLDTRMPQPLLDLLRDATRPEPCRGQEGTTACRTDS